MASTSDASATPAMLSNLPPTPNEEFCIFGRVYAHPEHADALEEVYALTSRIAVSEPGILHYCVARDTVNHSMFHFFERYTGRKAFEDHNMQPVILKLLNVDGYIKRVDAKFLKAVS